MNRSSFTTVVFPLKISLISMNKPHMTVDLFTFTLSFCSVGISPWQSQDEKFYQIISDLMMHLDNDINKINIIVSILQQS